MICYDKAIEIQPGYVDAWFNKGVVFDDLEKYEDAIICYDKAIEIQPGYVDAWLNKGIALSSLKKYDEAIICYDKLQPNADVLNFKAWTLAKMGRNNEAVLVIERSVELDPNNADILDTMGFILCNPS
jgi:tetratricopeptide (TPR) repeat protein